MDKGELLHDFIMNLPVIEKRVMDLAWGISKRYRWYKICKKLHICKKYCMQRNLYRQVVISTHLNYFEALCWYIEKRFVNENNALEYFGDYLKALKDKYGEEEIKKYKHLNYVIKGIK